MSKKLTSLLGAIIDALGTRLPMENIRQARDLLEHNEWGESLSLICTQLYEYDVPVPLPVIENIKVAAAAMKMDDEIWERLTSEK